MTLPIRKATSDTLSVSSTDESVGNGEGSFPHRYLGYGQKIGAEFALPELESGRSGSVVPESIDIEIVRAPILEARDLSGENGVVRADAEEILLHYDLAGGFLVEEGQRIVVDTTVDLSERLARHFVIGVCTGLALHQQGHFTLHASGVALEGKVAAFVGWKGRGKSTTASALSASGARLVTDDIVTISPGDPVTVLPGYPQMRLDPDAVSATLDMSLEDLPRLYEGYHKRVHDASKRFQPEPRPLGCIYVLEWGNDFAIEPLSQREAFVQLLHHSYAQRFLGKDAATPSHFSRIGELVKQIPVVTLERPRSLDQIPHLVEFIHSHFQDL